MLVCLDGCLTGRVSAADKEQECVQGAGQSYRGSAVSSRSGAQCLPWDSPYIKRRSFTAWRPDALELGLGSHSYCRSVCVVVGGGWWVCGCWVGVCVGGGWVVGGWGYGTG